MQNITKAIYKPPMLHQKPKVTKDFRNHHNSGLDRAVSGYFLTYSFKRHYLKNWNHILSTKSPVM